MLSCVFHAWHLLQLNTLCESGGVDFGMGGKAEWPLPEVLLLVRCYLRWPGTGTKRLSKSSGTPTKCCVLISKAASYCDEGTQGVFNAQNAWEPELMKLLQEGMFVFVAVKVEKNLILTALCRSASIAVRLPALAPEAPPCDCVDSFLRRESWSTHTSA
eukprot:1515915-Amphidinium_carterae.2